MSAFAQVVKFLAPIYPQAKRWLHSFNGGIFPAYSKELSSRQPIREALIPNRLIMPLQQQVGLPAELLVKVGDQVKKNQLIARSSKDANKALVVPIHAPTSGTVTAISSETLPHPSGLEDIAIIIEPDHLNTQIDNALKVSGKHPETPQQLKDILLNAGIVGMGGAGFPTYAKIPNKKGTIHTLMINGAECEPFITCDDVLMQTEAESIIQGALITANALGSSKIICGIETNKPTAIKAMQQAAKDTIVRIVEVQTVYPMGGQKQLTQELTGIEMPYKAHAVDIGMLMMNVATYASIFKAVTYGDPLTSRLVTVTGLGLSKPFNIHALIGTPFIDLAQAAEPKTTLNYPLIMGGPMMGFAVKSNQVPVLKTTNCILANPPEPTEMQMPCIRCGECMDACPINLLPQQMYWHSQAHEFDKVEKLNVFDCIECGCCSYVCPSHIPLVQYYRNAKSEIKEIHAEEKAVELAKQRHEFKLARIEREKQEREARLRAKKEAVKKQASAETDSKDSLDKNTSNKPKSSAAAAAAKAAAAKRAAAKNGNATASSETDNIPPARRKAIEAAQKATQQSGGATNPKEAAKKAAMAAAAKKREQAKATQTADEIKKAVTTEESIVKPETTETKEPSQDAATAAKSAAKTAAMAAAKAAAKQRAQAKKALTQSLEVQPIKAKQIDEQELDLQAEQLLAKEDLATEIATDLTEVTTVETNASKKEAARKAAMQAAKAAAKKRSAEKRQQKATPLQSEQSAESLVDSESNTSKDSPSETNTSDDNLVEATPQTKKQQAMQLAKQKAAERVAKKRAEKQAQSNSEESN